MTTALERPSPPGKPERAERKGLARFGQRAFSFLFLSVLRAFLSLFLGVFKRSDVYVEAISRATSDPEVRRHLGDPVREGWWVSGSLSVAGPSGAARLATTLHGSIDDGALCVQARKHGGRWQFDVMEVIVRGTMRRIDLLRGRALEPGRGPAPEIEGADRRR